MTFPLDLSQMKRPILKSLVSTYIELFLDTFDTFIFKYFIIKIV